MNSGSRICSWGKNVCWHVSANWRRNTRREPEMFWWTGFLQHVVILLSPRSASYKSCFCRIRELINHVLQLLEQCSIRKYYSEALKWRNIRMWSDEGRKPGMFQWTVWSNYSSAWNLDVSRSEGKRVWYVLFVSNLRGSGMFYWNVCTAIIAVQYKKVFC